MNRPPCLCSGYTQVDAFGPEDEYEDEEEEIIYVTLDCENVEPSLIPSSQTYRLIGLDTPTPFLQLSGTVLKGAHDTMLGTELLFVEDKDFPDRTRKSISYIASSEQRVSFREVRLVRKEDAAPVEENPETYDLNDRHALDRTTGNAVPPPKKKRRSKKQMEDDYEHNAPTRRRSTRNKFEAEEQTEEAQPVVSRQSRARTTNQVVSPEEQALDPDVDAQADDDPGMDVD